jgi:hypothetical protein
MLEWKPRLIVLLVLLTGLASLLGNWSWIDPLNWSWGIF